jgi:hypothetical protein
MKWVTLNRKMAQFWVAKPFLSLSDFILRGHIAVLQAIVLMRKGVQH